MIKNNRQEVRHAKWRRRVRGEENQCCKICNLIIHKDSDGTKHTSLCLSCQSNENINTWRSGGRKVSNEDLDEPTRKLRMLINFFRREYLGKI